MFDNQSYFECAQTRIHTHRGRTRLLIGKFKKKLSSKLGASLRNGRNR